MTHIEYTAAVRAAQAIMQSEKPSLIIDGKWGSFTQSSYEMSSPSYKDLIEKAVRGVSGISVQDLAAYRAVLKRSEAPTGLSMRSSSTAQVRALISVKAVEEGVPENTALRICALESKFNPTAVSPSGYKGLFQLGTLAMTDVYRQNSAGVDWQPAGSNKSGPLFKMTKPFDPGQNCIVGLRYIKQCAKSMGVGLNDVAPLYMAFNIGLRGAKNVLAGKPELAAAEISANPAYGRGVPSQYYAAIVSAVRNA